MGQRKKRVVWSKDQHAKYLIFITTYDEIFQEKYIENIYYD